MAAAEAFTEALDVHRVQPFVSAEGSERKRAIAAVSHAMLVTSYYLLKSCQPESHAQPFWTGF